MTKKVANSAIILISKMRKTNTKLESDLRENQRIIEQLNIRATVNLYFSAGMKNILGTRFRTREFEKSTG